MVPFIGFLIVVLKLLKKRRFSFVLSEKMMGHNEETYRFKHLKNENEREYDRFFINDRFEKFLLLNLSFRHLFSNLLP